LYRHIVADVHPDESRCTGFLQSGVHAEKPAEERFTTC
jgi:hypothetical protein